MYSFLFFAFFTSFTFITNSIEVHHFLLCTVLTLNYILWLRGSHDDEKKSGIREKDYQKGNRWVYRQDFLKLLQPPQKTKKQDSFINLFSTSQFINKVVIYVQAQPFNISQLEIGAQYASDRWTIGHQQFIPPFLVRVGVSG